MIDDGQLISGWWFQPIPKNLSQNLESSPNRSEHKKSLSCHHLDIYFNLSLSLSLSLPIHIYIYIYIYILAYILAYISNPVVTPLF